MNNPKFHINRQPWADKTEIYFSFDDGGQYATALPVEFHVRTPDDGTPRQPMMTFYGRAGDCSVLQILMDELWREGFRPKDIGTAGHLAATQAHLADFRALVSKSLDVKLP